eukprot:CAMPEP_0198201264 /NCGR_PEP_ID=MMETSP1445-20131203/4002_1 /TAXON_ID=36898 /ORGANISM="Pyramimonas sp., Strain CCMP2087" /LENGTH=126 /DNA_ID=CAMNT_0043871483 /DNA_START=86 /DNA_END=466 /DNA_ORIENTATION=+
MSVNQFSKLPPWKNQEKKQELSILAGVDWLSLLHTATRAAWYGLQAATAVQTCIAIARFFRWEQDVPVGEPNARIWQKEERVHVSLPPDVAGVYVVQCYPGDAPATMRRLDGVPLGVPETPQSQSI